MGSEAIETLVHVQRGGGKGVDTKEEDEEREKGQGQPAANPARNRDVHLPPWRTHSTRIDREARTGSYMAKIMMAPGGVWAY